MIECKERVFNMLSETGDKVMAMLPYFFNTYGSIMNVFHECDCACEPNHKPCITYLSQ